MRDRFGRNIEYMRISVTDRCNLRCVYCMPEEGVPCVSHSDILTYDEIRRICRIGSELGITRIKLNGGEPLVRRGLPDYLFYRTQFGFFDDSEPLVFFFADPLAILTLFVFAGYWLARLAQSVGKARKM